MGLFLPCWRRCCAKEKDFTCNATEHSSSKKAKDYSWSDSVALCGSELVVSSPGVLQEEIRHPAPPATSCPTGPLYHCSQISISPAGCLEIPGERKKINAGPVPCTPLRFFIRSLSLLINFKICFRDLMSQRRHPLISPRWMCLKVLPLWSAEFKKGFKKIQFPELWSINISAPSAVLLV